MYDNIVPFLYSENIHSKIMLKKDNSKKSHEMCTKANLEYTTK